MATEIREHVDPDVAAMFDKDHPDIWDDLDLVTTIESGILTKDLDPDLASNELAEILVQSERKVSNTEAEILNKKVAQGNGFSDPLAINSIDLKTNEQLSSSKPFFTGYSATGLVVATYHPDFGIVATNREILSEKDFRIIIQSFYANYRKISASGYPSLVDLFFGPVPISKAAVTRHETIQDVLFDGLSKVLDEFKTLLPDKAKLPDDAITYILGFRGMGGNTYERQIAYAGVEIIRRSFPRVLGQPALNPKVISDLNGGGIMYAGPTSPNYNKPRIAVPMFK